ncbi:hypothetical protein HYC85_004970 [Camellia sinensis]|uniref:Uncharacterized protein n=1 Tax=Camellia sinensis TaxID=4442 RepID=A0A7J7HZ32_CAMSI|nr:hypothetical protein HYC85_004970 [Camellia sinensis]
MKIKFIKLFCARRNLGHLQSLKKNLTKNVIKLSNSKKVRPTCYIIFHICVIYIKKKKICVSNLVTPKKKKKKKDYHVCSRKWKNIQLVISVEMKKLICHSI